MLLHVGVVCSLSLLCIIPLHDYNRICIVGGYLGCFQFFSLLLEAF